MFSLGVGVFYLRDCTLRSWANPLFPSAVLKLCPHVLLITMQNLLFPEMAEGSGFILSSRAAVLTSDSIVPPRTCSTWAACSVLHVLWQGSIILSQPRKVLLSGGFFTPHLFKFIYHVYFMRVSGLPACMYLCHVHTVP